MIKTDLSDAAGWIKSTDFVEREYHLELTNLTTLMPMTHNATVTITELADDGVVAEVPVGFCSHGHHVLVQIDRREKLPGLAPPASAAPKGQRKGDRSRAQASYIEATAKVTETDKTEPPWQLIRLKFYQYDESRWLLLLKEHKDRQQEMKAIVQDLKE